MPPLHGSASTSRRLRCGLRQRRGEHRRAGPATPGDHRDHRASASAAAGRVGGLGQFVHQFAVLLGQRDDVLGADGDGGLPVGGPRIGPADQHHPTTPRQRPVGTPARGVHVEQDRRRACPHLAAGGFGGVYHRDSTAAATRSTSSRSTGSATSASIAWVVVMPSPCCGWTTPARRARRSLWMKPQLGMNRAIADAKAGPKIPFRN